MPRLCQLDARVYRASSALDVALELGPNETGVGLICRGDLVPEFDWIPKRLTQEAYKRLGSGQLEDIRRRLHDRSPEDDLTAIEAAIYCGLSTRTIKRAIDAGIGPDRQKNPDVTGSGAVNRHTKFRKAELDAWKKSCTTFESFSGKFSGFEDLANDEPWVMDGSKVAGHLMDVGDIDDVMAVLKSGEVEFFRIDEALRARWVSFPMRKLYAKEFRAAVERAQAEIQSAGERDVLESETGATSGQMIRPAP